MKQQSGFTLIELVVVIVLLGILGAAATAKFQDLSTEANDAAAQGVAAEISSASAINYAKSAVGSTAAASISNSTTCSETDGDLESLMAQGGFPAAITIGTKAGDCNDGPGDSFTCQVQSNGTAAAVATLLCTSS